MDKEIAVFGCKIEAQNGFTVAAISVGTMADSAIKISNKGVYFGSINVSLTTVTDPSGTNVCASGSITISGTGSKFAKKGSSCLLKGDSGTATLTFTNSSTGATAPMPVTIKITDAGQSKVTLA